MKKILRGMFPLTTSLFVLLLVSGSPQRLGHQVTQKIVILMLDGFGEEYYRNSNMPMLNKMEKEGIYKVVPSLMPSVTNVNNASICTGELPEKHGITGNSYYDTAKGTEEFMEDPSLVLAPTIFQRAREKGVKSYLFSAKKKTVELLSAGVTGMLSPETASQEWTARLGTPPPIYSREVNYWLMEAALYTMQHDPSIDLFYIHTTDYPMHTWAAEDSFSQNHLHKLDDYIKRITEILPGAAILITADHTVKHKNRCVDLEKATANRGLPVKIALSAERDKYIKHHRGFGGTSYVYAQSENDLPRLISILRGVRGVEEVLTREQAAKKYHLMPGRIGDLVVTADENTVFGNLDTEEEALPASYRTHGSIYEARVPIFVFHALNAPPPAFFDSNYKVAAWLFR